MRAWFAVAAALALAAPAAAAPKGKPAKAHFDRGVAAYQKGDFAVASEALGASFKIEPDVETLFAWAQSERQLERCDKAIELFERLLTFDLPAENKQVVRSKIDECKALAAAKQPAPPPDKPAPPPDKPAPPPDVTAADPPDKAYPIPEDRPPPEPTGSPWWKDPIGGALTGAGIVGLGVGAYFLISASGADGDLSSSADEQAYNDNKDKAESHGKIGVISAIAGGVLVVGGIVRYATRGGGKEHKDGPAVSGWLSPDGGGITAFGRF